MFFFSFSHSFFLFFPPPFFLIRKGSWIITKLTKWPVVGGFFLLHNTSIWFYSISTIGENSKISEHNLNSIQNYGQNCLRNVEYEISAENWKIFPELGSVKNSIKPKPKMEELLRMLKPTRRRFPIPEILRHENFLERIVKFRII